MTVTEVAQRKLKSARAFATAIASTEGLQLLIDSRLARAAGRTTVAIFCEQPSHALNLPNLPRLIGEMWGETVSVYVICQFSKSDFEIPASSMHERVRVSYGTRMHALRGMSLDVLFSACVDIFKRALPPGALSCHAVHSLVGIEGVYQENHFDGFDFVACAGPDQVRDFEALYRRRAKSAIGLVPAGYPKLDDQLSQRRSLNTALEPQTVVYAPTMMTPQNESTASLRNHGDEIIGTLRRAGYHVIFRPHPVSLRGADAGLIGELATKYKGPGFEIDRSKDYQKTYARAGAMVTDLSGTGFTFAFTFLRPAIFFASNASAETGLHGLHIEGREQAGAIVRAGSQLISTLERLLASPTEVAESIRSFRNNSVFNVECSELYLATNLHFFRRGARHPNWTYV